jgi:hypothetical protein
MLNCAFCLGGDSISEAVFKMLLFLLSFLYLFLSLFKGDSSSSDKRISLSMLSLSDDYLPLFFFFLEEF